MALNKHEYDILIVGGGMVGLTLASLLAQHTALSIAILEVNPEEPMWSAETIHPRVSAIALSSQRLFQSLHVWEAMQQKRVSPFTNIDVWEVGYQNKVCFDSRDIAEPVLGYIIENTVMQSALREHLATCPRVAWIASVKLIGLQEHAHAIEVAAEDGRLFTGALAVAADGARSWLRDQAGIAIDSKSYEQTAIVTTVRTALPHQQTARQIFLETGPLAFLPLLDPHLCSIVWSLPPQKAAHVLALDDASFKAALAQAFLPLGNIEMVDARHAFPLHKQQAQQYVTSRLALVGDAAHTIHPLAGQGVNMGLLDAASLAEVLIEAINKRRNFASLATLRRYERWRRADNLAMLAGVDVIKAIFASYHPVMQTVRALGLNATQHVRWMKQAFVRHAVGKRVGLPVLARV